MQAFDANHSPTSTSPSRFKWRSFLTTLVIVTIVTSIAYGETIHSQLLHFGQNTWDDYFLLRGARVIQQPTCEREPDIESELQKAIAKKEASMADDPLAAIFGSDIDEGAMRQSIIGSAAICKEKWSQYETIQARVTPSVKAFRAVEITVQGAVRLIHENKRLILSLAILLCAAVATFARNHLVLRRPSTVKDHYVRTTTLLSANLLMLMAATTPLNGKNVVIEQGAQAQDFYLHSVWLIGFAMLALVNVWQLIKPPVDTESGGSWAKAFLTIPLYGFICLTASVIFIQQGYYHSISVYLGMMTELSDLLLSLVMQAWLAVLYIWLVRQAFDLIAGARRSGLVQRLRKGSPQGSEES